MVLPMKSGVLLCHFNYMNMEKERNIQILVCKDEDGYKTNILAVSDCTKKGSAEFEKKVEKALRNHFNVDDDGSSYFDEYVTREDWTEMVAAVAAGLSFDWLGDELYYETIELL